MFQPFAPKLLTNIDINAGATGVVVEIPFPPRSYLSRLSVVRRSGASYPFTVGVFETLVSAMGGSLSGTDDQMYSPESYRIMPELQSTGDVAQFFTDQLGYAFGFRETVSGAGRLYVQIQASGPGPMNFELVLGGTSAIG